MSLATLKFKTPPDYENPTDVGWDSVYKVVLVATDSKGGEAKRPVTVFVDNEHERGSLELTPEQPYAGEDVTTILTDPDENMAIVTWQWSRALRDDAEDVGFMPYHWRAHQPATCR